MQFQPLIYIMIVNLASVSAVGATGLFVHYSLIFSPPSSKSSCPLKLHAHCSRWPSGSSILISWSLALVCHVPEIECVPEHSLSLYFCLLKLGMNRLGRAGECQDVPAFASSSFCSTSGPKREPWWHGKNKFPFLPRCLSLQHLLLSQTVVTRTQTLHHRWSGRKRQRRQKLFAYCF